MKNTNISSANINAKEDSNMKKATIYNAIKTTINNALGSENSTLEDLRIAIENKSIAISELYKTECFLYAKKAVNRCEHNDVLCNAYNLTYHDLAVEITLHLMKKFDYLVKAYYSNHLKYINDEKKIIGKFSALVSLMVENKLKDMYKSISTEQDYEIINNETGEIEKHHGKGLKKTIMTVSLDQNNSDDEDDNLSLSNTIVSTEPNAEDRIISRSNILSMVRCLFDSPIELMAFMAKHSGISSTSMVEMFETSSATNMMSEIAFAFATAYDIPEIMNIASLYTNEQLTYSGSMPLKKVYDNARSSSNTKIKKYIMENK